LKDGNFQSSHGTNPAIVDSIRRSGKYDVVVRGHTHELEI